MKHQNYTQEELKEYDSIVMKKHSRDKRTKSYKEFSQKLGDFCHKLAKKYNIDSNRVWWEMVNIGLGL